MSTSRYNTYSDNYSASYISSKMPTYAILEHSSLQQPQVTLSQLVALGKVHSFLDVFLKLRKKFIQILFFKSIQVGKTKVFRQPVFP